jgi:hypothetical protein
MTIQKQIWILTIMLWTIMLIVYPFFYSNATGDNIFTQGDFALALVVFLAIGIGFKLDRNIFRTFNYIWATMTMTWILVANFSRLVSETQMQIIDAVYTRIFFVSNEWWIITFLISSLLLTSYYLLKNVKADNLNYIGQRKKMVTTVCIAIPILWCLTLNLKS